MTENNTELREQLRALQAEYLNELPERLREISQLWTQLQQNWQLDLVDALYRLLHKLAGSGASFGCAELSDIARRAEVILAPLAQAEKSRPDAGIRQEVTGLLAELNKSIAAPSGSPADFLETARQDTTSDKAPLLYLLEDDEEFGQSLALQLQSFGYQVEFFSRIDDLEVALSRKQPTLLIVDIMLVEGEFAGTQFIQQLKQKALFPVPVIVFSVRSDFEARLAAVKAGSAAYFVKPVEIDQLVACLDKLTSMVSNQEPLRILLVDDDEKLAARYALILSQAGMRTTYLTRPESVCQKIADFQPDLIVTDLYMPECSGIELAGLIRQYPQYAHIPIVFLSTETQLDTQLMALKMGGDDFLTKPIDDEHLLQCIRIRAIRARTVNELMVQDSLTGLLKHAVIKERLKAEVSRAKRTHSPVSFAMIDIDFFKIINDNHGHLMGDRVIKNLARLLRSRCRKSDIVGRYGGEEFAIIFPECTANQAKQIVDKIREGFAGSKFNNEKGAFDVSFSAGIAQFSGCDSAEQLNQAADDALYKAKELGRNRVEISC